MMVLSKPAVLAIGAWFIAISLVSVSQATASDILKGAAIGAGVGALVDGKDGAKKGAVAGGIVGAIMG